MTEQDKQVILTSLEKGSAELYAALEGVTEKQAARIPSTGGWSILQCVEHVATVEAVLFSLIQGAQRTDEPTVSAQREAMILARGADRTNKRESPEAVLPQGRFATLQEALKSFQASRARTVEFIRANEEDLRARVAVHPLMGPLNCHEFLLLMAVHPARHARQIEEIMASLDSSYSGDRESKTTTGPSTALAAKRAANFAQNDRITKS
ncbi:MAG: DinB family protein [Terracidiphilus sp.]